MSKINAMRIVNLNYNNNAIRIDDETFRLGGESTMFSLRNGGGKSVIVQMAMSLFVHKKYRDAKDRLFNSYFTTNKPTFIMVEWKLDFGANYALTGMMVRRRQDAVEDNADELEIINFIHEYKQSSPYDINNIPITEVSGQGKKLKGYNSCKVMFENLKKDRNANFDSYDMNVYNRSRAYFEKLEEYQIYCKEWETIIKKVNLKESGLSDLFAEAKDEQGLIEKWFLDAVENKLNKDDDRIKEFRKILLKYINQYKDNKSKIERRDAIIKFREETRVVEKGANELKDVLDEKSALENKIANFIFYLEDAKKRAEDEIFQSQTNLEDINHDIYEIEYEELSYEVYKILDELEKVSAEYSNTVDSVQKVETEKQNAEKQKHIQECAAIYYEYKPLLADTQRYENLVNIAKENNKDLTPERENLGYNLKCHYEKEYQIQSGIILELEEKLNYYVLETAKIQEAKKYKSNAKNKAMTENGRLSAEIKGFNDVEDNFNKRYNENIMRNITGFYEEGSLDIRLGEYREKLYKNTEENIKNKDEADRNSQQIYALDRKNTDLQKQFTTTDININSRKDKISDYELQIEERKAIIKYVGVDGSRLFETELIADAFDRKLADIKRIALEFEKEYDSINNEYEKLKSGKVLDLPDDFEQMLQKEDIKYVFGMEWLNKNNKSQAENNKLIKSNPFIPYSIIMSQREISRLMVKDIAMFTSFPIPIIKREDIEFETDNDGVCIYDCGKVSFFVLFNHNLLDEVSLKKLLDEKSNSMEKVKANLERKYEEIKFYEDKKNTVKFQSLNLKDYETAVKSLDNLEKSYKSIQREINQVNEEKHNVEELIEKLNCKIKLLTDEINKSNNKIMDFEEFKIKYNQYISKKEEYNLIVKSIDEITAELAELENNLGELNISQDKDKESRIMGKTKLGDVQKKIGLYSGYKTGDIILKDIEDIEARYDAITNKVDKDQKNLEEECQKVFDKFKKKKKDLSNKVAKYSLAELEYKNEVYDEFKEEMLEKSIVEKQKEIENLKTKVGKYSERKFSLSEKNSKALKNISEKFGREEPKPRIQIISTEFKKNINEKKAQLKREDGKLKNSEQKLNGFNDNITSLTEYDNILITQKIEFDENIYLLEREALGKLRGTIIRDYNASKKNQSDKRNALYQTIDIVMRNEAFEEDFFKKPLEGIQTLVDDPVSLISQMDIVQGSYDSLMAKLDVDIALVEREQEKITEMLLEYIQAIHENLDKIDKNSTIKVRDKSVKMLRIKLPSWEEQESIYNIRIKDMVQSITVRGIERLEANESAEEFISTQITTKNLYDTVVGISNVSIKLYKIEEQREYPITWADVAKNSGGEGFLSAFVILSSLLSFMRRDDTDIFSEREEGKVLIMDNPFAQTNAEYLLRPLMDIAKKSNTQLICFSGLGGDSIYNRFDNIYVLNLVQSNLRTGMQYMKSEHAKGEENIQSMTSSFVKVEDAAQQMGIIF